MNTKDISKIKERWTHCSLFSTLVLTISSFVPAEMYRFSCERFSCERNLNNENELLERCKELKEATEIFDR